MRKMGALEILLTAKEAGYIESVKPNLTQLRDYGFSISQYVVESVLQEANEN